MADSGLVSFLRMATSGQGTVTPEMWQHFDGDTMLEKLKKYDPNAKVITEDIGGGEGGSQGKGFRVEMDMSKLPQSKAGTLGLDLRESNFGKLKNPNAVLDDDNYGNVTNSANIVKPKDPLWTKLAPLVVGMGGPALGAMLAAEGIGGLAGLTASATGSGMTGVNSFALPDWAIKALSKAPQTAGQISQGNWSPTSLLPIASNAMGIDPSLTSGASTLANLARQRKP